MTREKTLTMEEEILQRGEKQGLERGLQGLRQKALEGARKMLERGYAWPEITAITGLHPEDLGG